VKSGKMKKKRILIEAALILTGCLSSFALSTLRERSDIQPKADDKYKTRYEIQQTPKDEGFKISPFQAEYAVNNDNLEEVTGFADNVFVAEVSAPLAVLFVEDSFKMQEPGDMVLSSSFSSEKFPYLPYSVYSVKVLENIKGNLTEGMTVKVYKAGGLGLESFSNNIFEYNGDELPNSNYDKIYIFCTYTKLHEGDIPAGTLVASGRHSTFPVEGYSDESYQESDNYIKLRKAAENQLSYSRQRGEISNDEVYAVEE
jgi:hypothetical protein